MKTYHSRTYRKQLNQGIEGNLYLNTSILLKEKIYKINYHLKTPETEKQTKIKANRKKEILKFMPELNDIKHTK
jgi:hypothetical protein